MGSASVGFNMSSDDRLVVEKAYREQSGRLRSFIRRFVSRQEDVEDILQDVFTELAGGFRAIRDTERIGSWLFTVARNRITDRYRKKKPLTFSDRIQKDEDGEERFLDEILPSSESTPLEAYYREAVSAAVEAALDEMPLEQREVFVGHELEGKSFRELSEEIGVPVNTLLSRKRYAVLRLREKLSTLYNEWYED
jgi:RNA polymerase sigma factor (sigma-70 family)